ncbi:hypothetical protein K7X08_012479 [Anisodus acutangulus]|uniref:Uncharacterized protein n=1 Tax=Anisodus acutangulus TaxID=402998 RepID=A0A9Q1LD80_9SOLA|nr:hypothetical protein K7X08_012479 [Anisodus acutangulus]
MLVEDESYYHIPAAYGEIPSGGGVKRQEEVPVMILGKDMVNDLATLAPKSGSRRWVVGVKGKGEEEEVSTQYSKAFIFLIVVGVLARDTSARKLLGDAVATIFEIPVVNGVGVGQIIGGAGGSSGGSSGSGGGGGGGDGGFSGGYGAGFGFGYGSGQGSGLDSSSAGGGGGGGGGSGENGGSGYGFGIGEGLGGGGI